jgi:DNA-binding NarL/FixJ family response regulator
MVALEKVHPDFIFLDVRLPDGSGFDLCGHVKQAFPHAIVILMTDYDIPEYGDAALRSGADLLISKSSFAYDGIAALIERKGAAVHAGEPDG